MCCNRRAPRPRIEPPRIRHAPLADRRRMYRTPRYLFLLKVKITSIVPTRTNWIHFDRYHAIHSREDVNDRLDEFEEETGEGVLEYTVCKTIRFADSQYRFAD